MDAAAPTPDERIARADSVDGRGWPPTLVEMGWWIADDVAVDLWGPLIDDVDLNDPGAVYRVRLPPDAMAGQQFVARFDAGGVVDLVVEERVGGALGSRFGTDRYAVPADIDWAWAVARMPPGPFPLDLANPR